MSKERRRFKRLPIPGDTIAIDGEGRRLGQVTLAGGGGIQIEALTADGERALQPGLRLRITVLEPAIDARHTVDVEVRFRNGQVVGVQFVTGAGTQAR